jgi:hypothetical protein
MVEDLSNHVIHTFKCCGWAYGCTPTSPDLGDLVEVLGDVSVQTMQLPMVETEEPFKLHPTSIPYIYENFKHLQLLWMGIWLHAQAITTTGVSQI